MRIVIWIKLKCLLSCLSFDSFLPQEVDFFHGIDHGERYLNFARMLIEPDWVFLYRLLSLVSLKRYTKVNDWLYFLTMNLHGYSDVQKVNEDGE